MAGRKVTPLAGGLPVLAFQTFLREVIYTAQTVHQLSEMGHHFTQF
jgi:hypothetical protein